MSSKIAVNNFVWNHKYFEEKNISAFQCTDLDDVYVYFSNTG